MIGYIMSAFFLGGLVAMLAIAIFAKGPKFLFTDKTTKRKGA